jgi:hypothetical protein
MIDPPAGAVVEGLEMVEEPVVPGALATAAGCARSGVAAKENASRKIQGRLHPERNQPGRRLPKRERGE